MAVWAIFVGMLAVSALLTALIAWTLSFHGRRVRAPIMALLFIVIFFILFGWLNNVTVCACG
jgi:hypothetical protein